MRQFWMSSNAVKTVAKWKRSMIALGTLAFVCPFVVAANPEAGLGHYAHTAWTPENSALRSGIRTIAQTPDGYLWLGVESGLIRFDGLRMVSWSPAPGQQLPGTPTHLAGAADGTLWIGTTGGLASLKNGRLTQYPALSGFFISNLLDDRDGNVWAAGVWGNQSRKARVCALRNGSATCYGDDGTFGSGVSSMFEDAGGVWIATGKVLWHWKPGPPIRYDEHANVSALMRGESASRFTFLSEGNLRQFAGGKIAGYSLPGAPSPLNAGCLLRDRQGALWIGTSRGVVYSYQGTPRLITHLQGLSSDPVSDIFEDREGSIWIGTDNGLDRFRQLPFASLSITEGLSSSSIRGILAARDGSVWIGTASGLDRWKDGRMRIYRVRTGPGPAGEDMGTLFEDERGRIWVQAYPGLAIFEAGRFRAVPSAPSGTITSIASDGHGGFWLQLMVNPNDYGLVHLVDGKVIEKVRWKDLGGGPGAGMVVDGDGGVWVALFSGGIVYFHAGQIRKLQLGGQNTGSRRVFNLWRGRDGALWAAGEDGLSRIANGRVETLTMANGLPCNTVHWVMEDNLSSYWFYTPCGLLRIARTELDAWCADPKRKIQPALFDSADGIRLRGMLLPWRPHVSKSPDGRIWFGNGNQVSVIDPSHIGINTLPPPVHIEQITGDDKRYPPGRGLHLPSLVRNVTIDYTALSLVAPEKVRFRYRLEGQDPDWSEVTTDRKVQYSNLPPRKYVFRVIACNNSGVWNKTGDTLEFFVEPAYYQTNWFRAFCVAAILGLLWGLYRFRVQQLEREESKFREAVETMPALAFVAQSDGYRTFVNKGWIEYTGQRLEQAAGSGWQAAIHPDDLMRVTDRWRTSMAAGEPVEYEARLRCGADGEYRWFHTRAAPLRDQRGKVVKWCGVETDIEDRKRAERLESDLAHVNRVSTLGEMTASIAHEINQPLSGIVSSGSACLRWLAADPPNLEEARQSVRRIVGAGRHAADVITRVRALTKSAAATREKLDLNETIREVLALVGDQAKRNSVRIRTRFADDLSPVSGDRVQLQQVVLNLVMNGIEAMSSSGERARELVITTRNIDADQVQVTVQDTGIGLDPNTQEKIFDSFYTTKPGGMGMGLSISRSILQAHGGRLWATAAEGGGAALNFTVPKHHEEESNSGA